jgi:hypothetical protein
VLDDVAEVDVKPPPVVDVVKADDALLVIPVIVLVEVDPVSTMPLACISLAVISVIVSTSETVAALIKISSGSDFISNKLPNTCVP